MYCSPNAPNCETIGVSRLSNRTQASTLMCAGFRAGAVGDFDEVAEAIQAESLSNDPGGKTRVASELAVVTGHGIAGSSVCGPPTHDSGGRRPNLGFRQVGQSKNQRRQR